MHAARGYYGAKLGGSRLLRVYDLAPPRVRQYLRAEVDFVLDHIPAGGRVLDLGCGYGRIMPDLRTKAGWVVGIDNSRTSLSLAAERLRGREGCSLAAMDAARMGFAPGSFDAVVCVQNGLSAFKVRPRDLLQEALRVTRPGGCVLASTYADAFWEDRLEWFRLQAREGLVGEIDESRTRRGEIVCRDGFRATTFGPDDLRRLSRGLGALAETQEVDGSSLFCVLRAR